MLRSSLVGRHTPPPIARKVSAAVVQARLGIALAAIAALCWVATVRAPMVTSLLGFVVGWVTMMAAMMLPALVPVVSLYARAAGRGMVAPVGFFLGGYLFVWSGPALPAYVLWQWVQPALMAGATWTGRLVGATLTLAALYQLTPLKRVCLTGCRSPLATWTRLRGSLVAPQAAVAAGIRNGLWCFSCCWALMLVLVAVGVMQPWWMAGVAVTVFVEKALPIGPRTSRLLALAPLVPGLLLLVRPDQLLSLTQ